MKVEKKVARDRPEAKRRSRGGKVPTILLLLHDNYSIGLKSAPFVLGGPLPTLRTEGRFRPRGCRG